VQLNSPFCLEKNQEIMGGSTMFNMIQPEVTSQRIKKCQGTLGCQDRALEIRELQDKAL
jgi:hypothetical protein